MNDSRERSKSGKGPRTGGRKPRPGARPKPQGGQARRPPRRPAPVPSEPLPVIELTIDALATGGEGVGRADDGRVAFVPQSAPGDRLRVALTEVKAKYARGVIEAVLEPAAVRVEPPCPLFVAGTCGGCQWQHLARETQLQAKTDIVARELRKAIARGTELRPMIAEVPEYHWRRRARLHYARPHNAKAAILGFYAGRGRRITDLDTCPQLAPALSDTLAILRTHLAAHLGSRGTIDILAGSDGHVHVAISGYCAPRRAARLVGKAGVHGTIMGVALYPPANEPDRARGVEPHAGAGSLAVNEWGKRSIMLEPGLRGRADLFAQASYAGNQALLRAVDSACGPRTDKRVLELFAGTGNFTRSLEGDALEIVASDSRDVPWRPELVVGDALEVVTELLEDGQYFDLVVLDPPRTGAAALMPALIDLHPQRIVYISCDPATLARDVERLVASGYRAEYVQPLDLMPQTSHIELVVALTAVES